MLFIAISVGLVVKLYRTTAEATVPQAAPSSDSKQSPVQSAEPTPSLPASSDPTDRFFPLDQPCLPTATYRRLQNGTRISDDTGTAGLGKLTVDNGTDRDATALLQDAFTGETARWIYVRSNRKVKLEAIEPGEYKLLYSFGYDWDENSEEFRVCPSYHEFGKPLTYAERKQTDGTIFDSISVTLHPVVFGNTKSRTITRDEFFKGHRVKLSLHP